MIEENKSSSNEKNAYNSEVNNELEPDTIIMSTENQTMKSDPHISNNANDNQNKIIENKPNKCSTCSGENDNKKFVYAIGKISIKFPDISLEKEFDQVRGIQKTSGKTDSETLYEVLKNNLYIARDVCWILTIEGIATYILIPKNILDINDLIESLNIQENIDTSVVIGQLGPIAPPTICNGLSLPILFTDKIYSFNSKEFIDSIPKLTTKNEKESKNSFDKLFTNSAEELFYRIIQIADNLGATDSHRALNYLAVRYPEIYHLTARMHNEDYSLESIQIIPSRLKGIRKILDPVFTYVSRKTDVREMFFVRVDVTDKYPFIQTPLTRYFERV